jgi:hypothetical protein
VLDASGVRLEPEILFAGDWRPEDLEGVVDAGPGDGPA